VDIILTITVRVSTIALVSQGFVNCCTTVWEIAIQDLQQVNNIKSHSRWLEMVLWYSRGYISLPTSGL